ncbi:MAG: aminotransferase class IV [Nannocystaceae bacterium]
MPIKVYLSTLGRPVDPADATISVFDRGFLYGDSVYETLRSAGGRLVEWERHLGRLRRSADGIGLTIPWDDAGLLEAVAATIAASEEPEVQVRMIVTRGLGDLNIDPRAADAPLLVILVRPLRIPGPEVYARGLQVRIVDVRKTSQASLDPTLKTGNYLPSILALRQAAEHAAEDAIMLGLDGAVAEAATSNVFMVQGGRLLTPSLRTGLLSGITRAVILELAAELGIEVAQATITPDQLRAADEVFLTSSVRGPIAVTTLDGRAVGGGGIGPVTQRILDRYRDYLAAIAGERR